MEIDDTNQYLRQEKQDTLAEEDRILASNDRQREIKLENKLRLTGEYEEWEKNKINENKISFLKEQIQAIEEWRDLKAPEFYNNVGVNYPELQKEKWGGDMTQLNSMADEALEEYKKTLTELENER